MPRRHVLRPGVSDGRRRQRDHLRGAHRLFVQRRGQPHRVQHEWRRRSAGLLGGSPVHLRVVERRRRLRRRLRRLRRRRPLRRLCEHLPDHHEAWRHVLPAGLRWRAQLRRLGHGLHGWRLRQPRPGQRRRGLPRDTRPERGGRVRRRQSAHLDVRLRVRHGKLAPDGSRAWSAVLLDLSDQTRASHFVSASVLAVRSKHPTDHCLPSAAPFSVQT